MPPANSWVAGKLDSGDFSSTQMMENSWRSASQSSVVPALRSHILTPCEKDIGISETICA